VICDFDLHKKLLIIPKHWLQAIRPMCVGGSRHRSVTKLNPTYTATTINAVCNPTNVGVRSVILNK